MDMKKEDISVIINVKLEDFLITFRQSPDNYEWTEMLTTDINPGHFDADRRPRTFMSFENHELDSIIKALTAYRDAVNMLE
jgi:hypothetical protein